MKRGRSKSCRGRWVLLISLIAVVVGGCQKDQLTEEEEALIEAIFRSGLEMGDDPYVRAETLRVLALTGDLGLAEWAEPLTRDEDRMVRVAALRKLLKSGHHQGGQRALMLFIRGNEREQLQVLEMVLRDGDEELVATILERGQRSSSASIRLRTLEAGLLQKIKVAREAGESGRLSGELLPELGRYVEDEDPEIAATALKALLEAGQEERANRFIATFLDRNADLERRQDAGKILIRARVEKAREAFVEILESVGAYDGDSIGIPERRVDDALVRLSVLGMTALGDPEFVQLAQEYRSGADVQQTLEVLDALGSNPSADAGLTLSTAMRDSHTEIRRRAIQLYGARPDAQASRLRGALGRDDFEAQKMVVAILVDRFAEEWRDFLSTRLRSDDVMAVEQTLELLRSLLRNEEELAVVAPLAPELERIAASGRPDDAGSIRRAGLAAYVLLRVAREESPGVVLGGHSDLETRYAYLEHLVISDPSREIGLLRENLVVDSFGLRLMAAAGLAIAFQNQLSWSVDGVSVQTQLSE